MVPRLSLEELAQLARNMTLKLGFWRIPIGGAKACVFVSPEMSMNERYQVLRSFSKGLAPFLKSGIFFAGDDMGCSKSDLDRVLAVAGCKIGKGESKSGVYTGWTVGASAEVAARQIGLDISASTVAIEGFGKVGSSAAQTLSKLGARIVAVSTIRGAVFEPSGLDVDRLLRLKEEYGDGVVDRYPAHKIDKSEIFGLNADILVPCAAPWSINFENARNIKYRIICPGANIPIANEVEEFLHRKGVLCIPDFISNSGGVFGAHIEKFACEDRIKAIINSEFSKGVQWIIEYSREKNITPRKVATEISLRRFQATKMRAEKSAFQHGPVKSLIKLLPKSIKNSLAPIYLRKVLDIGQL